MRAGRGMMVVAAAALAGMIAVTGCDTAPAVGDGEIGLDWAVLPEPVVPTPRSNVCTEGFSTHVDWILPGFFETPTSCDSEHQSETFHVGTLDADDSATAPELGDDLFREAYAACAEQADAYLGGDHRLARVFMAPVMPNERQWLGGARWFRCELIEITTTTGAIARRTASLRDGMRGSRPLAVTCANEELTKDRSGVVEITFVRCSIAHDSEMTGIHVAADGPYPGKDELYPKVLDACFGVGAKYLGMTRAELNRVGGISWTGWGGIGVDNSAGEYAWAAGNRSFWCFMGEYPARKLRGSIKNRRPGTFPH